MYITLLVFYFEIFTTPFLWKTYNVSKINQMKHRYDVDVSICICVAFVIKCRFPANKSIAEIIRKRYGENVLKNFRRLEKLNYKYRRCDQDDEFLKICLDHKLTPAFLRFKVTNSA